MDKEARQWREIYKALTLLEYIIKHGSERVVDDARSHLSTIKMLRNFHYIDEKGKDQGINVRNRAKELTELLMDVDRIRAERRKAKTNRNKYVGSGNDPMSFGSGRYGGFGSDTFGSGRGYGGGSYDSGYGGYGGGSSSSSFRDDRRGFDEYNAGDDEITAPRRSNSVTAGSGASRASASNQTATTTTSTKAQEKVVDLLGFGDDDYSTAPSTATALAFAPPPSANTAGKAPEKALPSNPLDEGDDDFADFQAAPGSAPVSPGPTTGANANIFAALAQSSSPTSQQQRPIQAIGGFGAAASARPASAGPATSMSTMSPISPMANRPSYVKSPPTVGGVMSPISATSATGTGTGVRPAARTATSFSSVKSNTSAPARPSSTSVGFDDLWNMSLGSSKPTSPSAGGTKSIKDLEKEKAQASIWGGVGQGGAAAKPGGANSMEFGLGNGTFGASSGTSTSASGTSAGGDDLLL
ncbi:ENTH-domain-containing protein [Sanghuangporus baumii]|uniref:ENTH-domain-containing protein n=1 Tax=Sanghuangporus baumii TaxID=108892 RepID=A0A9Q5I3L2_SANBA|nr:ENTH-domain-containing protein [Sanghuangporus baumii]